MPDMQGYSKEFGLAQRPREPGLQQPWDWFLPLAEHEAHPRALKMVAAEQQISSVRSGALGVSIDEAP